MKESWTLYCCCTYSTYFPCYYPCSSTLRTVNNQLLTLTEAIHTQKTTSNFNSLRP